MPLRELRHSQSFGIIGFLLLEVAAGLVLVASAVPRVAVGLRVGIASGVVVFGRS
jgi:hypothetical protein